MSYIPKFLVNVNIFCRVYIYLPANVDIHHEYLANVGGVVIKVDDILLNFQCKAQLVSFGEN